LLDEMQKALEIAEADKEQLAEKVLELQKK
jgi:hypothetical protein